MEGITSYSHGPTTLPANPFENFFHVQTKDKVKVAFMSVVVAPVRLVLAVVVLIAAYVTAAITLFNIDPSSENPLSGWRRFSKDLVTQLLVLAHFVIGFYRVKVKGRMASASEAPILVLAPHASFFDALPFCYIGVPSVVVKKSIVETPLVGKFLRLTVPILVDRDCRDSRATAMRKLCERANKVYNGIKEGMQWPQIAVFPEGTCTNRSRLITFKPGAFATSLPVQPVCIKWPNRYDTVSWTWDGSNIFTLIWMTLCQPMLNLEIEFLPVYEPSEDEKNDPVLYARNVREAMARCLKVPTSEFSVEDAPYLSYACKPRLKHFKKLVDQLCIFSSSVGDLSQLQLNWRSMYNSQELRAINFGLTVEAFASYLRLPLDGPLRRLFNMFDWQCRGRIDLREFMIATCCSDGKPSSEFIDYCLTIFTDNGRRSLSEVDFVKAVRLPMELSVKEARQQYTAYVGRACRMPTTDTDLAVYEEESDQRGEQLTGDWRRDAAKSVLVRAGWSKPVLSLNLRRRCLRVY